MQRGWQQQTLVQIVGTKALSHGRILCRNTLWKTCYLDTSVPKSISDRLLVSLMLDSKRVGRTYASALARDEEHTFAAGKVGEQKPPRTRNVNNASSFVRRLASKIWGRKRY